MAEQDQILDPARNESVIAEGISFEEFLKVFSEKHAEWIAGKVIFVSSNVPHQVLLLFLSNLLNLFLGTKSLGRVLLAGIPMYISDEVPAREPDLLIVLNENRDRIKETYLEGPADIVVEIVSPESSKRDRGDKFDEYEAAGVREYLLFDPLRSEAVFYGLGEDQRYHRLPTDVEGQLASAVLPGFALPVDLLWQDELPTGLELVEMFQRMVGA